MQGVLTYIEKTVARGVWLLLAALLACGLVPAPALAASSAEMGIELVVPSAAFVDAGDGSDVRATDALVGIRVEVPKQAFVEPGDGVDVRSASSLMGIRIEVPTQSYVDPGDGSDVRATEGVMGIRLEVPTSSFVDPDDGSDMRAAEGIFGIRLEVPKQAFVEPDDGADVRATDALVGIRLKVPSQAYVEDDPSTVATASLMGIRLAVGNTHTVTFDINTGTGEGTTSQTVLHGATVEQPDPVAATREGHIIDGWCTEPSCAPGTEYDFTTPVYGNFTLYAKWVEGTYEKRDFRLHMMGDGAALDATDAVDYQLDDSDAADHVYTGQYEVKKGKTLPVPAREGYEFVGWYADADYAGAAVSYISRHETGEPAYYAQWKPLPPDEGDYWTVTFDTRGGVTSIPDQLIAKGSGKGAERPSDPKRQDFDFTGWFADAACRAPYAFGTPVTADTTIYAGWERTSVAEVRHTVVFETQGGSSVARQSVRDGAYAQRPASDPTKVDARFVDWYADAACTTPFAFETTPIVADTTIYAGWRELERFDVTFYAAGGMFENAGEDGVDLGAVTIQVKEGSLVAADQIPGGEGCPVAAPKWAGWQFAGWYPEDAATPGQGDYTGDAFDFAGTPIEAATNVYAKWTLRLDVTVPASVGLAVDAGTGKVTAPGMGAYALKSRTVRPVEVEALALRSEQSELEGFFELAEGMLPDGASEADRLAAWKAALSVTRLTLLADAPGAAPIGLALAGDAEGTAWRSAYALTDAERAAYRLAAFSYADVAFDPMWQGADPSERLPLQLGMSVPTDKLSVRTDLDGEHPITRLQVTVAAKE